MQRRTWALLATVASIVAVAAFPTTASSQSLVGRIEGIVRDQIQAPLSAVRIQLTSPAMQGARETLSDAQGRYRFEALPPGRYTITLFRQGFRVTELPALTLALGDVVALDSVLSLGFSQSVTIQSDASTSIDRATPVGLSLSAELLRAIPTGRDYLSVVSLAPGVQSDASGPVSQGSSGAENLYFIDGMNTTGAEFGTQGKRLNYEFIEEIQVTTAAASVEQGYSTGGGIDVITKSGSNRLTGDLFGYYFSDRLQAGLSQDAAKGAVSGASQRVRFSDRDFGVSIGGPIRRDKLWFFGAHDRVTHSDVLASLKDFRSVGGPRSGQEYVNRTVTNLVAGKLSYRAWPGHNVFVSIVGDPSTNDGVVDTLAGPPQHFLGTTRHGGIGGAVHYDGVVASRILMSAGYGVHQEKQERSGDGVSLPGFMDNSDPLGDGTPVWGWVNPSGPPAVSGFGAVKNSHFTRRQLNGTLKFLTERGWGRHELLAGAVAERTQIAVDRFYSGGGDLVSRFSCSPPHFCGVDNEHPYYFRHRFYISTPKAPSEIRPTDVLPELNLRVPSDFVAFFAQDAWTVTDRLSIAAGLRWERQSLFNAAGDVQLLLTGSPAPRLGFRTVLGDRRNYAISGSWSRYFERVPLDIVIRSFGGEITRFAFNFSPVPGEVTCPSAAPQECFGFGGSFSPVDPVTKNQTLDEWVLGVDHDFGHGTRGTARFISRRLTRVIEDALIPSGDYLIGNPGEGALAGTLDIGYFSGLNKVVHPQMRPSRRYAAVEMGLTSRPSSSLQIGGSVTLARLRGNYDGTYQVSTGQLDPNLNTAYDFFDFQVNSEGALANDRPVDAKLFGSYIVRGGFDVGARAFYRSGTPLTAIGYADVLQRWEYYLSRRGEFGRTDAEFGLDLHLGFQIRNRSRVKGNLFVDIFNALNRQGETSRDLKYDLSEDYRVLDWVTSQPLPPITKSDPTRPPTNRAFNTTTGWQQPIAVRLGFRATF